ncbi:leucine-rich repeat isoform f [Anaeramoeba flamelloides]|uniref:Leucine-rich repeat isoform f n=1 Tax=Anaeramoeba flamelloides TaxID=1746091 RepID=A0AAV8ABI1_9EUKA|nr:leucine-rich repeat isoform f [Anaeramoeba flamelloides]
MSKEQEISQKVLTKISKSLQTDIVFSTTIQKKRPKKKKNKPKTLVLTKYRIIIYGKTTGTIRQKITHNKHLYDLKKIHTFDDEHASLEFDDWSLEFFTPKVNEIAKILLTNFLKISIGFPQSHFVEFERDQKTAFDELSVEEYPAKGFIESYKAWCNYFKFEASNDLIDYISKEIIENEDEEKRTILNLSKFRGINLGIEDTVEIKPILHALNHNIYFTELIISNVNNKELIKELAVPLKTNITLTKVVLSSTNATEGFKLVGKSIETNKSLPLRYLDLSLNKIPDKDVEVGLSPGLEKMKSGLVQLDLSHCNLSGKSIAKIFQSLSKNKKHLGLRYLNLSGNNFSRQGSEGFNKWAKKTGKKNKTIMLDFCNASVDIKILCQAIAENLSKSNIQYLNLSGNEFSKLHYINVATMCHESRTLKELDLSKTGLKPEPIFKIFNEILGNSKIHNFILNLSGNNIGPKGATRLAEVFMNNGESTSLEELILDDCKLNVDGIVTLCGVDALLRSKSLKRLSLSRNVQKGKKGKNAIEPLSRLFGLQTLEYLRIRGDEKNHLGEEIIGCWEKLSENTSIRGIDVQGNYMGQAALKRLFEAITNEESCLETFRFDNNENNLNSLQEFSWVFKKPSKLSDVIFPKEDVENFLKSISKREKKELKNKIKELKQKINNGKEVNQQNLKKNAISITNDFIEITSKDIRFFHHTQLDQKLKYNLEANTNQNENKNKNENENEIEDEDEKQQSSSSQEEDSEETETLEESDFDIEVPNELPENLPTPDEDED